MLADLEAQGRAAQAHAAAECSQARERARDDARLVEVDKAKLECANAQLLSANAQLLSANAQLLGRLAARERENAKLKAQLDLLLGEDDAHDDAHDDAQDDAQDDAATYADAEASAEASELDRDSMASS